MVIATKRLSTLILIILALLLSLAFGRHMAGASSHTETFEVSVQSGAGTVTSSPTGINCPGDCIEDFPIGTDVTFTANPATNRQFSKWQSGTYNKCQGASDSTYSGNPCIITVADSKEANGQKIYTSWIYKTSSLTVAKTGNGAGTVTSSPGGINCGSSCTANFAYNATVTLTAKPSAGSKFVAWASYDESGGSTCSKFSGTGKDGGESIRNPDPVCSFQVYGTVESLGKATAIFEKISVESPPTNNTNTVGSTQPSSPQEEEQTTDEKTITVLRFNDMEVNNEDGSIPIFASSEPIKFSGQAKPNAEITLYIFSEPKTAVVTADKNGYWEYTIDNLEPGDHRVEAKVKDPDTGEVSERELLGRFSVIGSNNATDTIEDITVNDDSSISSWVWIVLVLVVAGGSGTGYWFYRKKHGKPKPDQDANQKQNTT